MQQRIIRFKWGRRGESSKASKFFKLYFGILLNILLLTDYFFTFQLQADSAHRSKFFCSMVAIPIYVRHNLLLKGGTSGRIELTVGPKQSMGKIVSH